MKRILALGMFMVGSMAGLGSTMGQEPKEKPKYNLDSLFKGGDANRDGKLTKDEFHKMTSTWPKFKGQPDLAGRVFTKLDADGDGLLTLVEFKRITELRSAAAPAKPADKKPAAEAKSFGPPTAEQLAFFEKKIRPVLAAQCYKCHSSDAEKIRGGLVLDTREGIRKGGESGPAVAPGDLKKSWLIKALRHENDLQMPKEKLSADIIADFERRVAMGAPDPRDGKAKVVRQEIDIAKGRQFWAFQLPKQSAPPVVQDAAWPRSDIDRFLLAAMEAKGLKPVADADPETLVRRVYFDLIGLPPTPEEVDAFVKARNVRNANPQAALEKLVDELLASPRFGERWGRHWLDVARFAESSGRASNMAYPHAWRYREYVIDAFNSDKPFDRFVREQLAGDLLPAADDRERAELQVATGFLAIGPKSHNERVALQFQMDLVDEQIDTTFQALQGMTVACARCHDHKFDPIPTRDYYSLAGIFRSTETCYGTIKTVQSNFPSPLLKLPAAAKASEGMEPLRPAQVAEMQKQRAALKKTQDDYVRTGEVGTVKFAIVRIQIGMIDSQFEQHEADGTPKALAMGARERASASDSQVYVRGELDKPGDRVPRGLPQVLTSKQPVITEGSGRRELADWLVSRDNPLTARVMVNRVWYHLFGRGIVPTPDNFRASGQPASNQALLDSMAVSFMDNGWSVKKLIRTMVLSRAYQLSSEHHAKNQEVDPENALIWHMSKRRLEAEAMRDAMLAIGGNLELQRPRGSAVTKNGEGFVSKVMRDPRVEMNHRQRSVYLPIVRDGLPESLGLFDFPDPTAVAGERASTTIPAQALYLMNSPWVTQQAKGAAERLLKKPGSEDERIGQAYRMFLGRQPNTLEVENAAGFLKRYSQTLTEENVGRAQVRQRAWSALCQALFASAEFSYVN